MKVRDDVVYHVDCFRCTDCGVRLVPGDRFALDNNDEGGVVCQRDHLNRRHQQLFVSGHPDKRQASAIVGL